jgi:hypothetical protein
MADKQSEAIKYETEVAKTTVLVAVAAAGGSIGLLLGDHTPLRLGLASVGVLVTVVLVGVVWRLDRRIRRLIGQIKETI